MSKILLTKYFPEKQIKEAFDDSYSVKSYDFIDVSYIDLNDIQSQIPTDTNKYIVTSIRTANHIQNLELNGEFYCVGEKSKTFLESKGFKVAFTAYDAKELLSKIEEKFNQKEKFVYFCSDIRQDILPNGIKDLGHDLQEIITYKTVSKKVEISNNFDAYVFFSPSGVKSFVKEYTIPQKAFIFAIGKTTGKEINTVFNRTAFIPEKPDFKLLINTIKTYLNAEK